MVARALRSSAWAPGSGVGGSEISGVGGSEISGVGEFQGFRVQVLEGSEGLGFRGWGFRDMGLWAEV